MIVILLKSILAGIGTAAAVGMVIALYSQAMKYRMLMVEPAGNSTYVETRWHVWPVFCVSIVAFAAGFWWQYRKAR
jgi:hypothetical protein